jgi:HD-GYP domain-containing protein (c-di-GMP phosphodiesterase class II)
LNRPRKLNLQEFELIKMHVESGYQILKDVEFPWAIAEIVYQHHENMDGSGYPRGLAGEQILPEARILRVCDALEAMLSHRPFRRAYTLPQALAELQVQSGSKLDKHIVDICVRLFNEQGYTFSMSKTGAQ